MKIVLPGGSGQIGTLLGHAFQRDGHEVVELSRRPSPQRPWHSVGWDARTPGAWTQELEGADVVINLAGRSVDCRYTAENRRLIMESRVNSTRALGAAIRQASRPPKLWLQSATATIYAHRYDAPNDEETGIIGGAEPDAPETWRFSIEVAQAWERAVAEAGSLPHTRTILLRSAMTMSPDAGGVFDVLLRLVRFGLGGAAGDGRQFMSWIHEADFIRAIYWLIAHEEIAGPVNLAAPDPLPNAEFMRVLRASWGMPIGLPATAWMIELGAFFLRTESELVLKSRRVVPGFLLQHGFSFAFPTWNSAARDLCERWRLSRGSSILVMEWNPKIALNFGTIGYAVLMGFILSRLVGLYPTSVLFEMPLFLFDTYQTVVSASYYLLPFWCVFGVRPYPVLYYPGITIFLVGVLIRLLFPVIAA